MHKISKFWVYQGAISNLFAHFDTIFLILSRENRRPRGWKCAFEPPLWAATACRRSTQGRFVRTFSIPSTPRRPTPPGWISSRRARTTYDGATRARSDHTQASRSELPPEHPGLRPRMLREPLCAYACPTLAKHHVLAKVWDAAPCNGTDGSLQGAPFATGP